MKKTPELYLKAIQLIAEKQGGICHSEKYFDNHTKLDFECKKGHRWSAIPKSIKKGHWCPNCAALLKGESQKLTIELMRKIATDCDGLCLSNTYVNNNTKLEWECKIGHRWRATPSDVKGSKKTPGTWCPKCSYVERGENNKLSIKEMKKIASDRGGTCLSSKYVDGKTKLKWRCSNGHEWMGIPESIKFGRWCPECSSGLTERICRSFFEQLFNKEFPKAKPKWLYKKKGDPKELDGFNEELGMAFEHHGIQHYEFTKHYHKNKKDFERQLKRDKIMQLRCEEANVLLIEVPEINRYLKIEDIKEFIKSKCQERGLRLPDGFDKRKVILKDVYSPRLIEELQEIAKQKKGSLLSNVYLGGSNQLKFKCFHGHVWKAKPNQIRGTKNRPGTCVQNVQD
jgi:hypothetical protein